MGLKRFLQLLLVLIITSVLIFNFDIPSVIFLFTIGYIGAHYYIKILKKEEERK